MDQETYPPIYILTSTSTKIKVLNTNIMKVLGPLVTKQYFDGDLDLDEYNNSIYKAHYIYYIYGL